MPDTLLGSFVTAFTAAGRSSPHENVNASRRGNASDESTSDRSGRSMGAYGCASRMPGAQPSAAVVGRRSRFPSALARSRLVVMPLRTKRWNDPREVEDGFRLL